MNETFDNVALIIPAYNEGAAIAGTIDGIPAEFRNIIIIDDGSRDDTRERVAATRAKLVKHPINLGQGAALQTGIDFALLDPRIEYFVTYDADGQHRIEDVRSMLTHIKQTGVDIVLGSRFLGEAINMPTMKRVILKAAVWFSNITSGVKLTDTHNGLRVFSRATAQALKLELPDFSHASEIIERIGEKGMRYAEVPVTIIYTDYSRSKGQSMINAVNIGFDALLRKVIK
ncbi:Undecaprenyl-phosphate mannosyltransferase [compost metagenome]|uniref:Glycosyl transferase n=1 Tax=Stenotrophomonas humi TaxID=405444 RepID=A0A0R0CK77_9GAMM|nr:glycosyltransferase family 2 protein [Stenotrophomonas humi]KRG66254.1 glycosyl transferase [Stenotrophomonas humi]